MVYRIDPVYLSIYLYSYASGSSSETFSLSLLATLNTGSANYLRLDTYSMSKKSSPFFIAVLLKLDKRLLIHYLFAECLRSVLSIFIKRLYYENWTTLLVYFVYAECPRGLV